MTLPSRRSQAMGEPESNFPNAMCGESSDVSVWGLLREHRKRVVLHLLGLRGHVDVSTMYRVWGPLYHWSKWNLIYKVGVEGGKSENFLKIRWHGSFEAIIHAENGNHWKVLSTVVNGSDLCLVIALLFRRVFRTTRSKVENQWGDGGNLQVRDERIWKGSREKEEEMDLGNI